MRNRDRENMPATYHFGLKTALEGHPATSEFLCDGYVKGGMQEHDNSLVISTFLCDGYVIGKSFYLMAI
jgi:hypothetical protein